MRPSPAKSIPAFAAATLVAIGAGVLTGWITGFEPLMTVLPGLIRMKPNTAAAFLFAAVALYFANSRQARLCASRLRPGGGGRGCGDPG